jgi:hypothetical protein
MNPNILTILLQVNLKEMREHVNKAIGVVASEYSYAKRLQNELNKAEKDSDVGHGVKKVNKALHILYWLSRGERKADMLEKDIIESLKKFKKDLPSDLQQKEDELIKELQIAEGELSKKASLYVGDLRKELKNIKTVEQLARKYRNKREQKLKIIKQLKLFFSEVEADVATVIKWLESTEVILKEVLEQIQNKRLSRRKFMKTAIVTAAAAYALLSNPFNALARETKGALKKSKIVAGRLYLMATSNELSMKQLQEILSTVEGNYNSVGIYFEGKKVLKKGEFPKLNSLDRLVFLDFTISLAIAYTSRMPITGSFGMSGGRVQMVEKLLGLKLPYSEEEVKNGIAAVSAPKIKHLLRNKGVEKCVDSFENKSNLGPAWKQAVAISSIVGVITHEVGHGFGAVHIRGGKKTVLDDAGLSPINIDTSFFLSYSDGCNTYFFHPTNIDRMKRFISYVKSENPDVKRIVIEKNKRRWDELSVD